MIGRFWLAWLIPLLSGEEATGEIARIARDTDAALGEPARERAYAIARPCPPPFGGLISTASAELGETDVGFKPGDAGACMCIEG
jgi:hypothetical protein